MRYLGSFRTCRGQDKSNIQENQLEKKDQICMENPEIKTGKLLNP